MKKILFKTALLCFASVMTVFFNNRLHKFGR